MGGGGAISGGEGEIRQFFRGNVFNCGDNLCNLGNVLRRQLEKITAICLGNCLNCMQFRQLPKLPGQLEIAPQFGAMANCQGNLGNFQENRMPEEFLNDFLRKQQGIFE